MTDIAGFGVRVWIRASNTFPIGVSLTQFADDADPLDMPSMQIADSAMGLNGDLISWGKANPIKLTLALIPSSLDDDAMAILFEANRIGKGKIGAQDVIDATVIYASGRFVNLTNGVFTDGMPANSISSAGRMKSKVYAMSFENKVGV